MYILICQLNSQEKVKTEQTTGNKQRKGNDIIIVLFDKPLNRAEFPLHGLP